MLRLLSCLHPRPVASGCRRTLWRGGNDNEREGQNEAHPKQQEKNGLGNVIRELFAGESISQLLTGFNYFHVWEAAAGELPTSSYPHLLPHKC